MAKQGLHGFKWDRAGYQQVQNSGKVQSILRKQAGYAEGNANAAYGKNIYRMSPVQGRFAKGYVVSVALGDDGREYDDAKKREDILRGQL